MIVSTNISSIISFHVGGTSSSPFSSSTDGFDTGSSSVLKEYSYTHIDRKWKIIQNLLKKKNIFFQNV